MPITIKQAGSLSALGRGASKLGKGAWAGLWPILSGYGIYSGGTAATEGVEDMMRGDVSKGAKRVVGGVSEAALNAGMMSGSSLFGQIMKGTGATGRLAQIGAKPGAGLLARGAGHTARGAAFAGEMGSDMYLWNRAAEPVVNNRFLETPKHYNLPPVPNQYSYAGSQHALNPYR